MIIQFNIIGSDVPRGQITSGSPWKTPYFSENKKKRMQF